MAESSAGVFRASDGYEIHQRTWRSDAPPRGIVVVLHGVQSHGGWYHNLGRCLADAGFLTCFPDRRGSGANQVDRGHVDRWTRLVDDTRELIADLRGQWPGLPVGLAGISWGGKIAVLAASGRPDLVSSVALICPGLQPRVGVGLRERLRIGLALLRNRRQRFPIPLADPALFTNEARGQEFIANDPLGLRDATASLLFASAVIDRRLPTALRSLEQPMLLMLAEHDRIVDNQRTLDFLGRTLQRKPDVIDYPGAHHTLEFEPDPNRYADDLACWFDRAMLSK